MLPTERVVCIYGVAAAAGADVPTNMRQAPHKSPTLQARARVMTTVNTLGLDRAKSQLRRQCVESGGPFEPVTRDLETAGSIPGEHVLNILGGCL